MSPPPRVRTVLPDLRGGGVLLAAPVDTDRIRRELSAAGFALAEAHLGTGEIPAGSGPSADHLDDDVAPTTMRGAQAAIAEALRLPEAAGRNLDALVDSLRDLATWWPDSEQVVLLLLGAESLVESDLPGWHTLTEILQAASADLWRGGVEGDRAFETVALVARHGVLALPEAPAGEGRA